MRLALIAALLLAGCVSLNPPAPGVIPDANGLQPVQSTLRIDFYRHKTGVLQAVSRLKGSDPKVARSGSCETAEWPDGLRLHFIDGNFRGWSNAGNQAGILCR